MVLLDQQRLSRIIKRMAFQVVEKSRGHSVDLIGLNERGFAVAGMMESFITRDTGSKTKLHQMVVDRDDVNRITQKKE